MAPGMKFIAGDPSRKAEITQKQKQLDGFSKRTDQLHQQAAEFAQAQLKAQIDAVISAAQAVVGNDDQAAAKANQDRWRAAVRAELLPEVASAAWQAGRGMSLDEVFSETVDAAQPGRPATSRGDAALPLSAREREVAALLAQGLSNRDIAERLVVSERTAENHVQHVLNRLGLRSRAQVATWAVRNGLGDASSGG